MRSETVTTVLPAPREEVFAYMADIENLPRWATEFARELRCVDGEYRVVNNLGEFHFEIRADPSSGVIDMLAGPVIYRMLIDGGTFDSARSQMERLLDGVLHGLSRR